jgi:Ser-tRNA(Ala) deacylase AlaX
MMPCICDLQQRAQTIIDANQEIINAFSDEQHEKRYWKIEEFSQVACGGTHIKRTGEIGNIHLKRVNLGKEKERLVIFLVSE